MKKADVVVGANYIALVSGALTTVRVISVCCTGGWNALNLATGRGLHIRGAQRLRRRVA